ncbi:helix-turn-helix domain-containing protein [Mycobacteroides abscessus]|uniref:helix-turn-helix domain-containing protein n=1 Tax=Mycobacteroides abscessus TaxID=36809 RepID=UPI000D3EBAA4|nr:helix-turn-helix transcriptional regulator [Mycobacteroides abscessus]PVB26571.1 XRE family transcriptional regulator [Mycobacteroides abscessus]
MPNATNEKRMLANIRAEIARAGHSQSSFARQIHMSQPAFSRRMLGRTPFTVGELTTVAESLGVTVARLMGERADASAEPAAVAS